MDIQYIEYAAKKFFEMCSQHPEICPHDYNWIGSCSKDDKLIERYKCGLCGNEYTHEQPTNRT